MRCLGEPPIGVRRREDLALAAWGDARRVRRSLDSRILSLRRRIAPLGLSIATVRGEGFVLAYEERDG
jgi:DNA-binding winged helix-turn-helix (wHTH) protein